MSGNATQTACHDSREELGRDEAAALIGVAPVAIERWSKELSFPHDVGAPNAPRFRRREIEALRDALGEAHSVEGAVRAAQRRVRY